MTSVRSTGDRRQLGLFAGEIAPAEVAATRDEGRSAAPDDVVVPSPDDVELAARLPAELYLGTSSWSFPGWTGLVYGSARSEAALARDGLREYARHPLLRTVGIDRGYYAPIPEADYARYAEQLPDDFRCVVKVWDAITTRRFPRHARWGAKGGESNPDYLHPGVFAEHVLAPCAQSFLKHLGALVLEFPPSPPDERPEPARFADELAAFFSVVPRGFPYAVEIRDRALLCEPYLAALREHEVVHVINYWSWMPTPREQIRIAGILTGPFGLARLMLRPGTRYEDRKSAMAPFDRIRDPDPEMRASVVDLWELVESRGMPLFVTINNKAEGSAPLTARAIAEGVVARRALR